MKVFSATVCYHSWYLWRGLSSWCDKGWTALVSSTYRTWPLTLRNQHQGWDKQPWLKCVTSTRNDRGKCAGLVQSSVCGWCCERYEWKEKHYKYKEVYCTVSEWGPEWRRSHRNYIWSKPISVKTSPAETKWSHSSILPAPFFSSL